MPVLSDTPSTPPPADHVRELVAVALVVGALAAAVAWSTCGGRRASDAAARCERILDRSTDLRIRAANGKTAPRDLEQRQAEARAEARRSGAMARCEAELDDRAALCAESAQSADELERCFP